MKAIVKVGDVVKAFSKTKGEVVGVVTFVDKHNSIIVAYHDDKYTFDASWIHKNCYTKINNECLEYFSFVKRLKELKEEELGVIK